MFVEARKGLFSKQYGPSAITLDVVPRPTVLHSISGGWVELRGKEKGRRRHVHDRDITMAPLGLKAIVGESKNIYLYLTVNHHCVGYFIFDSRLFYK